MLIGTKSLKKSSIDSTLAKMGTRAVIASPFHVLLFFFCLLYRSKELQGSSFAWIAWYLVIAASAVRVLQLFFMGKMLTKRRALWRAIFTLHTWTLGCAWGFTSALTLYYFGVSITTISVFISVICISAASVPSFSFDLGVQFIFQALMTAPVLIVIFLLNDGHLLQLGVAFFFYFVFILYAGFSLFRFQIEVLKSAEVVEDQNSELASRHLQLSQAHEVVEAMVESVDEVFLTFNVEGICEGEPSKVSKELLGLDPRGLHLCDVLQIPAGKRVEISDWFAMAFNPAIDFGAMSEWGPAVLNRPEQHLVLKLKYHLQKNKDGSPRAVTLTGTDVSREMRANAQAESERERVEMILKISENKSAFRKTIDSMTTYFNALESWDGVGLKEVRRNIHNYRGASNLFGMTTFSKTFYQLELRLHENSKEGEPILVREVAVAINRLLSEWKSKEQALLTQLGVFKEEIVEVPVGKFNELLKLAVEIPEFSNYVQNEILGVEVGELLAPYQSIVMKTAAKLGRQVQFILERPAEPVMVNAKAFAEFFRSLAHLFNNAIDHGIETPDERKLAGKNEHGKLTLRYSAVDQSLHLRIEDDGRGIAVEKIRAKLMKTDAAIGLQSDLQVAMHIFDDGLSTAKEVSDTSGQGVGMGAVSSATRKLGGHIRVAQTGPTGTVFELKIPINQNAKLAARQELDQL